MNSHPSCKQSGFSYLTGSRRYFEAWRELLDRCALKPSRKRVHALRSATLRLESVLEFRLRDQPVHDSAVRAFRRWKKQAGKLRRALRPLRDADVCRQRFAAMRATFEQAGSSDPPKDQLWLRQIEQLEGRLEKRRTVKT